MGSMIHLPLYLCTGHKKSLLTGEGGL